MKRMLQTMLPIGGFLFTIGSGINYLQDGESNSLWWTIGSFIVLIGSLLWTKLSKPEKN